MMFFVMSFAGMGGSINENSTFPDLGFYAEAEVSNPNLLGGVADSGGDVIFQVQDALRIHILGGKMFFFCRTWQSQIRFWRL